MKELELTKRHVDKHLCYSVALLDGQIIPLT